MNFTSSDQEYYLRLQAYREEGGGYCSSVYLLVQAAADGFSGVASVYFDAEEWDDFVTQLRRCEQTRRGTAALVGGYSRNFALRIESCDSLGHFVVRYELARYGYGDTGISQTLTGGFELDAGFFSRTAQTLVPYADLRARSENEQAAYPA